MSGDGSATYTLRAQDATAAAFNSVNKRIDDLQKNITGLNPAFVNAAKIAAAAAVSVAGGLALMTKNSVEALAAQNDLAETLGVTQKQLVSLQRAADLSGVSSEVLAISMRKLNNTIGEAQGGNKGAIETFAKLGMTADEVARLPMDERFSVISKAVSEMATQTERAAFMQDAFGRGGQALLPMIQDGGTTLKYAADQTKAWGLALNDLDMSKVKEADDKISDVKANFTGITNQLAVAFAPAITVFSEKIIMATSQTRTFGNDVFSVFENVAIAVGYVGNVVQMVERVLLSVKVVAWALSVPFVALSDIVARLVDLLPGIDMTETIAKMNGYLVSSVANFKAATAELRAHGEEKWATDQVRDYFIEVKEKTAKGESELAQQKKDAAAQAALAAAAAAREEVAARMKAAKEEEEKYAKKHGRIVIEDANPAIGAALAAQAEAAVKYQEEVVAADLFTSQQKRALMVEELLSEEEMADTERSVDERTTRTKEENRKRTFEGARGALSNLSVLMNSHSRKAFEVGKAAAISETLMNTYASATGAFKSLVSIPFVGPALAAAAAGAAVIAGMANVQSIRSQQFGGGGGGSPAIPSSVTASASAAMSPVAPSLPQSSQSGGPSRNVTLIVQSDSGMVSMDWVRNQLAPVVNEAIGDGVTFMVA